MATRSAPCAARDMPWAEGAGDMTLTAPRWNLLAASLYCVAATESAEVSAFLHDLAPWMPGLMPCDTSSDFLSAVERFRPDLVIVGPDFHAEDLRSLAAHLATSGLGLAIVGLDNADVPERFGAEEGKFRRIEIEPLDSRSEKTDVVLRLRALLRRCRPAALTQKLAHGDMVLDESALTLSVKGKVAPLALEGYRIIAPMFDDPEHVWTREELLSLVYGSSTTNGTRTVDVKLNVTRRRLRSVLGLDPVQTVRGLGYRLALPR